LLPGESVISGFLYCNAVEVATCWAAISIEFDLKKVSSIILNGDIVVDIAVFGLHCLVLVTVLLIVSHNLDGLGDGFNEKD
jgi:hypothetical protein